MDRLDAVPRAAASATRPTRCAVLYIDVDRFKLVNDSLSHAAGRPPADRSSPAASGRSCARATRSRAWAATSSRSCSTASTRPLQALAIAAPRRQRPSPSRSRSTAASLSVSASIGIAHNSDGASTADELIRNADIAMYDAKAQGGGPAARIFDAQHAPPRHRPHLARGAAAPGDRAAAAAHVLPADRRPADAASCTGSRRSPAGRPATRASVPAEFIPVAEDSGLIGPLGVLMLRSACETLSDWRAARARRARRDRERQRLAAASSPRRPRRRRPRRAHDTGLPAANLVLEITESTLIENPELRAAPCSRLLRPRRRHPARRLRHRLLVAHGAARLPGDTLKIDRTFVATMIEREPRARRSSARSSAWPTTSGCASSPRASRRSSSSTRAAPRSAASTGRATTSPARSPPPASRPCSTNMLARATRARGPRPGSRDADATIDGWRPRHPRDFAVTSSAWSTAATACATSRCAPRASWVARCRSTACACSPWTRPASCRRARWSRTGCRRRRPPACPSSSWTAGTSTRSVRSPARARGRRASARPPAAPGAEPAPSRAQAAERVR